MTDATGSAGKSFNHALTGMMILGGIAVSGLVLLMVVEAGGGQNWMFNAFLLVAIGSLALYARIVYRSQQNRRERVESS